ncbi:hypothetical protein N0V86_000761 [Didymella sp. IMI 355093]|nr:hypothetical protein N0V86_000761 [Didymella sp. IMI 355093]
MRAKETPFSEKIGTATNSTSCFSPAARAVETIQMQSLLPSTEKILLIVEYHEQFLTYWGGGLYHGPTLRQEIREATNPSGKIDLTTVDWRWTGLLFSILSSSLIGSPEGVSLEWGFSIEEKVRLSRLWGTAAVTSLNLGDYTSQYHLNSIQAIMSLHGFEHLVGSSSQWAALRSVAMVIARGLNLHRIGPHPDDERLPYLNEEQKKAFIERELGRRVWYAAATQEWLCSSSQTFPGYNIQRKHFTTSKPAIFDEETVLPVEEGTPTFAVVGNYFFEYAYLLLQFGDAMLEAEDLDETDINAEAQEYLACVKRAVVYLASFPTSSVANHGVRVLTSLLQEYTKKVEAGRSNQTRPMSQNATSQMPQLPKGLRNASLGETGLLAPTLPADPEVSLSNDATSAFNFDIDMMEFEDLLDILPTEMGVDPNAFYDGMLSASNGAYNPGW